MPNPGDYRHLKNNTMSLKQLVVGAVLVFSTTALAQESLPISEVSGTDIPVLSQQLRLADQLVAYGYQTKSALPLIQAVQIYHQLNVTDDPDNSDQSTSPYSEATLLNEATKYADGNKTLLTLIKEVNKGTRSGGALGPLRYYGRLAPGSTNYRHVYVSNNQFVQVVLDGQGEGIKNKDEEGNIHEADLHLTLYTANMRELARDHAKGVNCVVCYSVQNAGTLSVEMKNVGDLSVDYVLYIYRN